MKFVVVLGVLVVVIVVALGYGSVTGFLVDGIREEGRVTVTTDEDPTTPERDVSVDVIQGGFVPDTIVVNEGDEVTVHLTGVSIAEGFDTHGFAIKEFGVDQTVGVGEEKTVTFTADVAGFFPYFCSVFCGQGHIGQAGTLVVLGS